MSVIEFDGSEWCSSYKMDCEENLKVDLSKIYTDTNIEKIRSLQTKQLEIPELKSSRIYIENPKLESESRLTYSIRISYLKEQLEKDGFCEDKYKRNSLIEYPEQNKEFYDLYNKYVEAISYGAKNKINEIVIDEKIESLKDLPDIEDYNEFEKYVAQKIYDKYNSKNYSSKFQRYMKLKKCIYEVENKSYIWDLETEKTIKDTYNKYKNLIDDLVDYDNIKNLKWEYKYDTEEDEMICIAYKQVISKVKNDLNL